ncbi:uncharacterized protein LY79DRAFT_189550 [Colletotrichum navitas]|uniref:Uncharacterized protein n=1 Tax=Colletotrichum navitas TaxID=681940 RepID=A0AAD8V3P6_9PEZI|nr:uncharacterized protein LY79DRAFT_189550 [Colletotrichum navitas]KAK1593162.1 hypothetical protein LY79DRAFT_189550 [Colletotrichum navitas]
MDASESSNGCLDATRRRVYTSWPESIPASSEGVHHSLRPRSMTQSIPFAARRAHSISVCHIILVYLVTRAYLDNQDHGFAPPFLPAKPLHPLVDRDKRHCSAPHRLPHPRCAPSYTPYDHLSYFFFGKDAENKCTKFFLSNYEALRCPRCRVLWFCG